ncbi:uncharacterized protein BP01DRAFT_395790 [Aspergillus saccharolyticus JOP 1030-1]|uniref:Uncharacterized protein n=1 Tax=Aspergillus saccharolyticus JOP 1030-1 TaxID=1450539 RepID=A0A318Z774_9EURO|nr:hypothetical protein BP01DRAFT_395790 [Aspergillus saccharolyticus JOP 1030-1]PYH40583.1 hypothetical protein BP01DRAFT_395790 [Aspergillus saccharolyticus JOP 1030-1]
MASRKFSYHQQDFSAFSHPDLGQTDDHELHSLDDIASSQPVPLLELCMKTSSRNKGARAQKQCLSESAVEVGNRAATSIDQDLVSTRFLTFRQSISTASKTYRDQPALEIAETQADSDIMSDSVLDTDKSMFRLHTLSSSRSPSHPSSARHASSTGRDITVQQPSTPTRVNRYNLSESCLDSVVERGDTEFLLGATSQYKPSARLSRFYNTNASDLGSMKGLAPIRPERQSLGEAKSDQGWLGAGDGHIRQNPLSYSKSSTYSYGSSHIQSRSCISESPFQKRDTTSHGDHSTRSISRAGSLCHDSASEKSCPPASSLHLYGANFDQTYNRSPYESLRVQQERFKRAESRRISSGLQFPMSASQQAYSSENLSKEILALEQTSKVVPLSQTRTPPYSGPLQSSHRVPSQRQTTDAHKSDFSSNAGSGLSADDKRRIFKAEVNALLKSAADDPRDIKPELEAYEHTVESRTAKAPSTDNNQASFHDTAVVSSLPGASANVEKQKVKPESGKVATTPWSLLERAALDSDKVSTANSWPPMPRYRPRNIHEARRFATWGDYFSACSSFSDVEESLESISLSKVRDEGNGVTPLDLKTHASAYIKQQILICAHETSVIRDSNGAGFLPSVTSNSKSLKPPPGLHKPDVQMANRPTWYVDSIIQNQARLEESNAWFRPDYRGSEALRAQVALFSEEYGKQLKNQGLSTEKCESAKEMSEFIGNALVNLSSYVLGDRGQQTDNFANFTPAPSECSSPNPDKHRTFFEHDLSTNCETSPDRKIFPGADFSRFARHRTSSGN